MITYIRLRVVFMGKLANEDEPLKIVADKESIAAVWITSEELKTKRLRTQEVLRIFQWVEKDPEVFPLTAMDIQDGEQIDDSEFISQTVSSVNLIVKNNAGMYLAMRKSGKWGLPYQIIKDVGISFEQAAKQIQIERVGGEPVKVRFNLEFMAKVYYRAAKNSSYPAYMNVTYFASFHSDVERNQLFNMLGNDVSWCEIEELRNDYPFLEAGKTKEILNETLSCNYKPFPLRMLVLEGSPYS